MSKLPSTYIPFHKNRKSVDNFAIGHVTNFYYYCNRSLSFIAPEKTAWTHKNNTIQKIEYNIQCKLYKTNKT